jgi:hypothetical protein
MNCKMTIAVACSFFPFSATAIAQPGDRYLNMMNSHASRKSSAKGATIYQPSAQRWE